MEGYGTDAYLHLKKVSDPNPNSNPNPNPNPNPNSNSNFNSNSNSNPNPNPNPNLNLDVNLNPKGVGFERTPSMMNDKPHKSSTRSFYFIFPFSICHGGTFCLVFDESVVSYQESQAFQDEFWYKLHFGNLPLNIIPFYTNYIQN